MQKRAKPPEDHSDDVPDLGDDFFARAKRGRPPLPDDRKKRRVNIMLDPDIHSALKAERGSVSERINRLLREDLGM